MTDIVERLRQWSEFGYGVEASATMKEAADEIERLRADLRLAVMSDSHECKALSQEVERLVKSRNRWGQKYNALLDKHKRLRAALEPFAAEADCWPDHHDDEPLVESFPEYDGKITVGACRRARAALEGK